FLGYGLLMLWVCRRYYGMRLRGPWYGVAGWVIAGCAAVSLLYRIGTTGSLIAAVTCAVAVSAVALWRLKRLLSL
ncbi:MAG: hypothetical protein LUI04_02360, partial [Porphyromonadaceae bacterium]|nr:hypothetical protein [Porphyromonadaceae bacterium]